MLGVDGKYTFFVLQFDWKDSSFQFCLFVMGLVCELEFFDLRYRLH